MKLTPEELVEVNALQQELAVAQQEIQRACANFLRVQGASQYVGRKIARTYGVIGAFDVGPDGELVPEKAVATGE